MEVFSQYQTKLHEHFYMPRQSSWTSELTYFYFLNNITNTYVLWPLVIPSCSLCSLLFGLKRILMFFSTSPTRHLAFLRRNSVTWTCYDQLANWSWEASLWIPPPQPHMHTPDLFSQDKKFSFSQVFLLS